MEKARSALRNTIETPTIMEQVKSFVARGSNVNFCRVTINPEERARLAKHAPNALREYDNPQASWGVLRNAIGHDQRVLTQAYNKHQGSMSSDAVEVLDTLELWGQQVGQNQVLEADHEATARQYTAAAKDEAWRDPAGNFVNVAKPGEPLAARRDPIGCSLGEFLCATVRGARTPELRNALSEGTDSAGGFTVPDPLSLDLIDRMRAKMVTVAAGARSVPITSDTLRIARLDTDPTVAWRLENGVVTESDPTFSAVTFTVRSLAGVVKLSRELFDDSVNIATALPNAFAAALALEVDRVALFGTGTPPEPRGLANVSGIQSVSMGTNGAAPTNYSNVLSLLEALETANTPQVTALIGAPRTKFKYAGLTATDNQPLMAPKVVNDIPWLSTTAVPVTQTQGTNSDCSSILAGDFSQMMLGFRASVRIEVLRETYASNMQYAFLAWLRFDVQFAHPAAFGKLIGIRP